MAMFAMVASTVTLSPVSQASQARILCLRQSYGSDSHARHRCAPPLDVMSHNARGEYVSILGRWPQRAQREAKRHSHLQLIDRVSIRDGVPNADIEAEIVLDLPYRPHEA